MGRMQRTWDPGLAYAIGLIATDGNLSSDGRHVNLTSADKEQLVNFQRCLGINTKLSKNPPGSFTRNPIYRVQFSDRAFYHWLEGIGLKPRKTARLGRLSIPRRLFRDFLRGVIDGDGSIFVYTDRYNVYKGTRYEYLRLYVAIASSSRRFLEWIQEMSQELLSVRGSLLQQPNPTRMRKPHWKLRFAKQDSVKILRWLYYTERLPSLTRKRVIAEEAMRSLSLFRDKRIKRYGRRRYKDGK